METAVTLTPNPAIDISTAVDEVLPIRKLRCEAARRDPGGGGINVARVVRRLGGEVSAIYPAGARVGHCCAASWSGKACGACQLAWRKKRARTSRCAR